MMKTEKTLVNVSKGQDAYSVIGSYISNHITAIEDMIAVIQINDRITNELYMVDMNADGYFYWESDWWEGEEDVALIDFFPVSEAERPQEWIPCKERLPEHPENNDYYLVTIQCEHYDGWDDYVTGFAEWTKHGWDMISCYIGQIKAVAWKPLPEPYKEDENETD